LRISSAATQRARVPVRNGSSNTSKIYQHKSSAQRRSLCIFHLKTSLNIRYHGTSPPYSCYPLWGSANRGVWSKGDYGGEILWFTRSLNICQVRFHPLFSHLIRLPFRRPIRCEKIWFQDFSFPKWYRQRHLGKTRSVFVSKFVFHGR
jgi:hypothetical protein